MVPFPKSKISARGLSGLFAAQTGNQAGLSTLGGAINFVINTTAWGGEFQAGILVWCKADRVKQRDPTLGPSPCTGREAPFPPLIVDRRCDFLSIN